MNIPNFDLNDFITGNQSEKDAFIQNLGDAFTQIGFVSIINHGLSKDLTQSLYVQTESFFNLPEQIKYKYQLSDLHGQRGYTSFGKEHAKGSQFADLKEFFQFGQIDSGEEMYPGNVSVEELPLFNPTFETAFSTFEHTGIQLLSAIAIYLQLPDNYFASYVKHGNSILRAIHYPPIADEPLSAIRAEQHEDINLITLLVGASAEGLQILTKEGNWLSVHSKAEEIIVNVGDMLQRLTNDRLQSTTHRVVNPPRSLWHQPRYSIPFFLHPVSSMSLNCLDNCVDAQHPKKYSDITSGQYLDERLIEIGLKK
jgi:isopenicillin N synthase-like dioxygenase